MAGGSSERPRIRKEMQNVNPISVQIFSKMKIEVI